MTSLRGQLLIASPTLQDPRFSRTVVLLGAHSEEGAMGVVLNRPSETPAGAATPFLADLDDGEMVFLGGPVQPTGVIVLGRFLEPAAPAVAIEGQLGFLGSNQEADEVCAITDARRVFAGHAGWAPGQLEDELSDDAWIVADVDPDDPFTDDPLSLWPRILERLGGSYSLIARMPEDPRVN